MRETILVIDASPEQRQEKERMLQYNMHYQVVAVPGVETAMGWLQAGKKPSPDIILIDANMNDASSQDAIRSLKASWPNLPIIVMTLYADSGNTARALSAGAHDCLQRPVPAERLRASIQNALKIQRMSDYITWLERKVSGHMSIEDMVGGSHDFLEAAVLARQAAKSEMPVWIEGEPGVGKHCFACAIHGSSDRAGKPFVVVNCELLPQHLAYGMLFGQEKSSLPLSNEHFILGKLREADHGTLLLQEIGALAPEVQQQLLDMLQSKAIKPAGSAKSLPVNVRLICTASTPNKYSMQQHAFKQKLLRLCQVVSIALPALKYRKGDVTLLAQHFLVVHATSENKYISGLTEPALEWLNNHSYPGNVGQLANLIWRAVMLCEGNMLDVADLQAVQKSRSITIADYPQLTHSTKGSALIDDQGKVRTLKSVQEEAIRFALQQAGGCMTRAARSLGIGRSTLYRKVDELSLTDHISRANQTTRPTTKVSSTDRS